eukprot:Amastigsp_a514953_97.p2 type:complete len:140 gc:universal Amastigsp_a514953_97:792-373(-)
MSSVATTLSHCATSSPIRPSPRRVSAQLFSTAQATCLRRREKTQRSAFGSASRSSASARSRGTRGPFARSTSTRTRRRWSPSRRTEQSKPGRWHRGRCFVRSQRRRSLPGGFSARARLRATTASSSSASPQTTPPMFVF